MLNVENPGAIRLLVVVKFVWLAKPPAGARLYIYEESVEKFCQVILLKDENPGAIRLLVVAKLLFVVSKLLLVVAKLVFVVYIYEESVE